MKFDINTLEFESFKEFLLDNFISSFSKSSFKIIDILSDIESIYKRQNEIKQAVEYRESTSFIDDDNDFFSLFYSLTDKTKSFDPMDFVVIKNFLIKLSSLKEALEEKKYSHLLIYSESFSLYQHLIDLISKSINDKGVVKDDATPRLQEIRYSLNQFKNNIRKILSNIFNSSNADKFIQDKVIVLRNGRYTIPCKTNFSQYIQGIIQDKSASGQTLYIEPASCVSENNAMQELIIAESEEIAKIIFTLITAVKSSLIDLNKTVKNYSYLIIIRRLESYISFKKFIKRIPLDIEHIFCNPGKASRINDIWINNQSAFSGKLSCIYTSVSGKPSNRRSNSSRNNKSTCFHTSNYITLSLILQKKHV